MDSSRKSKNGQISKILQKINDISSRLLQSTANIDLVLQHIWSKLIKLFLLWTEEVNVRSRKELPKTLMSFHMSLLDLIIICNTHLGLSSLFLHPTLEEILSKCSAKYDYKGTSTNRRILRLHVLMWSHNGNTVFQCERCVYDCKYTVTEKQY